MPALQVWSCEKGSLWVKSPVMPDSVDGKDITACCFPSAAASACRWLSPVRMRMVCASRAHQQEAKRAYTLARMHTPSRAHTLPSLAMHPAGSQAVGGHEGGAGAGGAPEAGGPDTRTSAWCTLHANHCRLFDHSAHVHAGSVVHSRARCTAHKEMPSRVLGCPHLAP